jgi:hypothetical protein
LIFEIFNKLGYFEDFGKFVFDKLVANPVDEKKYVHLFKFFDGISKFNMYHKSTIPRLDEIFNQIGIVSKRNVEAIKNEIMKKKFDLNIFSNIHRNDTQLSFKNCLRFWDDSKVNFFRSSNLLHPNSILLLIAKSYYWNNFCLDHEYTRQMFDCMLRFDRHANQYKVLIKHLIIFKLGSLNFIFLKDKLRKFSFFETALKIYKNQ